MLRITADVYSGRNNPAADVLDAGEARAALRDLARDLDLFSATEQDDTSQGGLGLRGFWVEFLEDGLVHDFDLEARLYLPVAPGAGAGRTAEVAERLVALTERGQQAALPADAPAIDESVRSLLLEQLSATSSVSVADQVAPPQSGPQEQEPADVTCQIEFAAYNPGFWNNDATIRTSNNCYNYASNWRTNTFAQPGRGCGSMYTAITCQEVGRAALCDGMHHRFDCFPDTEKPRYLAALAVIPGGGDYHWYRKMKEGFWGHKPGGTAVRNVDNRGNVILDPAQADRGPYTIFCGYFYGCTSQQRRIR